MVSPTCDTAKLLSSMSQFPPKARLEEAQMEQPGTSVYCKDNGFCHVPPLPAQCTKNSDCVTPWYSSWCMNDASKHAPYVCKEMLPPKCKTDKDCER